MYLNFWPPSVDSLGSFPAETLERNRFRTLQVEGAAARATMASRTVAPLSSFEGFGQNILNDARGAGFYIRTAGQGTAAQFLQPNTAGVAPQVVPLNVESWSAMPPANRMCGENNPYPGAPWADAGMYRAAALGSSEGDVGDWIKRYPVKALLLAALGGFGLYTLGQK